MSDGPARVFHVVEQRWRWFEDVPLGETFACGGFTLDDEEIIAFATRYDPHAFHLDPEVARASFVGALFASAIQTLAASVSLFVRATRELETVIGLDLRETELRRPACTGVAHAVRARWVGARPSRSRPGEGVVTWEADTVDPEGRLVMRFGSGILVRRRPGPSA